MRKIFRMAYETCSGQCYDHSDVMRIHNLGLDVRGAAAFLKRLLAMHGPACGNANLQFRLDADEWQVQHPDESWPPSKDAQGRIVSNSWYSDHVRFVASFYRYGALDLFSDDTALGAMNKLIDGALAWYASEEGQAKLGPDAGTGRESVCHHGTDEKLVDFALAFSGLNQADQSAVRAQVMP